MNPEGLREKFPRVGERAIRVPALLHAAADPSDDRAHTDAQAAIPGRGQPERGQRGQRRLNRVRSCVPSRNCKTRSRQPVMVLSVFHL